MLRRHFLIAFAALGCCLCWLFSFRRVTHRKPEGARPTYRPVGQASSLSIDRTGRAPRSQRELAEFARERISKHLPAPAPGVSEFLDPFTILTIIGVVLQLIQVCKALYLMRQHIACRVRPTGQLATRIKAKLHAHILQAHPHLGVFEVQQHIDASFQAFIELSPRELDSLKEDLDANIDHPTEIKLFDLSEELSQP